MHISAMAKHYVKDPRDLVKAGDVIRVKVMDVDLERRRIALSMRLSDPSAPRSSSPPGKQRPPADARHKRKDGGQRPRSESRGAMAEAFARLKLGS